MTVMRGLSSVKEPSVRLDLSMVCMPIANF